MEKSWLMWSIFGREMEGNGMVGQLENVGGGSVWLYAIQ